MNLVAGTFLNAQIDLYAAQSAAAAGLSNAQTIGCDDLEDAIALGLSTYASLCRHSGSWAADAALGKVSFSWETSRQFTDQYRRWKEMTATLLNVIDLRKSQRHDLASERELRDAFKDVSLMPLDTDRMRAAYESLQEGEGISHSEAMNELRRCLAARST